MPAFTVGRIKGTGQKVRILAAPSVSKSVGKTKMTNKRIAKIAKKVVNRAIETKYTAQPVSRDPIQIYGDVLPAGGLAQIYDVLPDVTEGDAEFQRTGIKINPTRHTVDVDLRFNQQVADVTGTGGVAACAWDITAHVWYGYVKRYRNGIDVLTQAAVLLPQMFEDGVGNTTRWRGDPWADFLKLNNEVFQMKHKAVRMYRPLGTQNEATLGGGLTTYFPQHIRQRMRLSFKPPKTLLYNESSNLPENYAPVVVVAYMHNDFTQAANTTTGPASALNRPALQVQFYNHLWYKDA